MFGYFEFDIFIDYEYSYIILFSLKKSKKHMTTGGGREKNEQRISNNYSCNVHTNHVAIFHY